MVYLVRVYISMMASIAPGVRATLCGLAALSSCALGDTAAAERYVVMVPKSARAGVVMACSTEHNLTIQVRDRTHERPPRTEDLRERKKPSP